VAFNLNKNLARQWSRIGPRGIYGQSLLDLAENNKDIFAISADLGNSSGLDRYKNNFPARFLNIGIAEQNLVGFASGLSSTGFNVFVSSFAPFITMRACEQVRLNLGYMRSNVKIVSIGSGLSMGFLGNSHFGIEDISIIRSIPNIPIICPSDCFEVYKAVQMLINYSGPAYLRLTGGAPTPILNSMDFSFKIGESRTIKNGNKILILSTGTILGNVVKAAEKLEEINSISSHIENVHTLIPLDSKILDLLHEFPLVITVEEHSVSGGLGTIISELITQNNLKIKHSKIGLPHKFLKSGTYEQLLDKYSLSCEKIWERFLREYRNIEA